MESVSARHGVREGFGVVIVEVLEDTPAARAGMRNGDIVVALNDRPVTETRMLQRLIAAAGVDQDVRLIVLRPEGRRPLAVRLSTMPRSTAGERVAVEFGFALREADPPAAGARRRDPSRTRRRWGRSSRAAPRPAPAWRWATRSSRSTTTRS